MFNDTFDAISVTLKALKPDNIKEHGVEKHSLIHDAWKIFAVCA